MRLLSAALLSFCLLFPIAAQTQDPPPAPSSSRPAQTTDPVDKRAFYILPNYRTADRSKPFHKLSSKSKMMIAVKDSFDWPVIPAAAGFAGLYQLENQNPSFGQGLKGYGHRFATAYGDQIISNFMTEGIWPSLFHQDPRYFRSGQGSGWRRAAYAVSAIFVTRTDSGGKAFNLSEWGGNATAVAISNAYYPDTRTVSDNVGRLLIACGTDALSDVMKEFWPDVKRRLSRKKNPPPSSGVH